jgi:hypothetical protein
MSKKWELNQADVVKIGKNFLIFGAPALIALFSLLAQGVEFSKAYPVALFVLYQLIVDTLKKLQAGK